jgi:hypothetical protein
MRLHFGIVIGGAEERRHVQVVGWIYAKVPECCAIRVSVHSISRRH